jgi:hypothetical protein
MDDGHQNQSGQPTRKYNPPIETKQRLGFQERQFDRILEGEPRF